MSYLKINVKKKKKINVNRKKKNCEPINGFFKKPLIKLDSHSWEKFLTTRNRWELP